MSKPFGKQQTPVHTSVCTRLVALNPPLLLPRLLLTALIRSVRSPSMAMVSCVAWAGPASASDSRPTDRTSAKPRVNDVRLIGNPFRRFARRRSGRRAGSVRGKDNGPARGPRSAFHATRAGEGRRAVCGSGNAFHVGFRTPCPWRRVLGRIRQVPGGETGAERRGIGAGVRVGNAHSAVQAPWPRHHGLPRQGIIPILVAIPRALRAPVREGGCVATAVGY